MREIYKFLRYVIDGRKVKALLVVSLVWVLSLLVGCQSQLHNDIERFEAEKQSLISSHAAELEQLRMEAEAGIYASQYMPQENIGDAYDLAVWLGSLQRLYPGISQDARSLACWGVFCRLESGEYPDNVETVLLQPGQFDEFDPEGVATEENIAIAQNQLSRWKNGDIRPCGEGAVYISVSGSGCVLRDTFEEGRSTNYWRAA